MELPSTLGMSSMLLISFSSSSPGQKNHRLELNQEVWVFRHALRALKLTREEVLSQPREIPKWQPKMVPAAPPWDPATLATLLLLFA